MPIINQEAWNEWEKNNKDPYGKCCVDVARRVMELLDKEKEFDTHKIICKADDEINAGGITGFMAGCIAEMVTKCHSKGEEFRCKWNLDNQIHNEGEKINESGGIINPALITISINEENNE